MRRQSGLSFAFEEGRKHAVTIACSPKQCHTDKRHDTFTVALRHRDFILNMTTAALQADTAQVMVPADSCFAAVTAIDDHKTGEIQGQRLDSKQFQVDQPLGDPCARDQRFKSRDDCASDGWYEGED